MNKSKKQIKPKLDLGKYRKITDMFSRANKKPIDNNEDDLTVQQQQTEDNHTKDNHKDDLSNTTSTESATGEQLREKVPLDTTCRENAGQITSTDSIKAEKSREMSDLNQFDFKPTRKLSDTCQMGQIWRQSQE